MVYPTVIPPIGGSLRVDFPPQVSVPQISNMPQSTSSPLPIPSCSINGTAQATPYANKQGGISANFNVTQTYPANTPQPLPPFAITCQNFVNPRTLYGITPFAVTTLNAAGQTLESTATANSIQLAAVP
jgi:hypothetical protein